MTAVAVRPAPPQPDDGRRRVLVWLGEHLIADYIANADLAARYEAKMRRSYAGLRVTNEPLHKDATGRELPSELLWDSVPPH